MSLSLSLWKHGPQVLWNQEMWHVYKPTKANIDAIPVFCGHVAVEECSSLFSDISKYQTLKDLLVDTINIHPDILNSGDNALNQAEVLWIKHIQARHFPDIIEFLQHLKGHNLRSIEGKKIFRAKKLIVPSLCLNFHLVPAKKELFV